MSTLVPLCLAVGLALGMAMGFVLGVRYAAAFARRTRAACAAAFPGDLPSSVVTLPPGEIPF